MLLLIAFCVVLLIQIYFYFFIYRKYTSFSNTKEQSALGAVSVVVCAKNEESTITALLLSLARQDYFSFEIILVDDASTDGTWTKMQSFFKTHQNSAFGIELIQISPQNSKGKKFALTKGINTANNPIILLTDADCQTQSKDWIYHMANAFSENTAIVLGYGAYEKTHNSFINKLIRFETLLTAIQYFSYAIQGNAYMGVGRNLAYRKSVFIQADGFDQHSHIKSGDDDLFVSQIAKVDNIEICDAKDSFTISKSHRDFSSWIRQKRRHITTASHYKYKTKFLLSLFYISQFLFYFLLLVSLATNTNINLILSLTAIRFLFWYTIIIQATKKLDEKDLIAFGPLYEISIIFMQLYIFLKNIISPPKYW